MTTLAMFVTLALASATDGTPPTNGRSPCSDVFDRVPGCSAVAEQPLEDVGEPVEMSGKVKSPDALNEVVFSPDAMAWQLIASSGVVAVLGAGLFAASFAYGIYAGEINAPPGDPILVTEYATGWAGVGAFVLAGLLGGAGAIFFVFDPGTGRLRLDLSED